MYRIHSNNVISVENSLRKLASTLRFALIISLIKLDEDTYKNKTLSIHNKKMMALMEEKKNFLGVMDNPNNLVIHLID